MLFSQVEHYNYDNAQLMEVICQLRYPTILKIESEAPALFQEQVRSNYPRYVVREENLPPKIAGVGGPNPVLEKQGVIHNHCFISQDGLWQINMTKDFISLSTHSYPGWKVFASRLDQVLAAFITTYQPSFFQRIGLRYVNAFSRQKLQLESTPWKDLFAPSYLGILGEEDAHAEMVQKSSVDSEFTIGGSTHAKIHAGPGLLRSNAPGAPNNPEVHFILDIDMYMAGETQPALSAACLETLHGYAIQLFEGAITDELHTALKPKK